MAKEEIEEVDDSESNKSCPSKTQEEEAPYFGCSEIVVDDSESNKAGPSGTQENEQEFESLRSQVNELGTQVDYLRSQIDDIIFDRRSRSRTPVHGRRSRSRTPVHGRRSRARTPVRGRRSRSSHGHRFRSWRGAIASKVTHLGFRISKVTRPIRSRSKSVISQLGPLTRSRSKYRGYRRMHSSTSRRYGYRKQTQRFSPTLEDEEEMPEEEESPKSESGTAHQRYLRKGKATVTDSSSPQQHQGVHVDPRRRLEFDIDSLLKQVSDLKYEALNLITQAGGGRFQDLDVTSQADGARAQAPDLTSQISGARSQSSKASIHYEQQQQALMPRKTVAEEDELKLMRAVERLEIINKTEPVRPIRRNIELPDKVFLLQYQVTDLESLVKDLRSQHRSDNPDDKTRGGSLRHSQRPGTGRSNPTLERKRETEPSSSDSQKRRGKGILKGWRWLKQHWKTRKSD